MKILNICEIAGNGSIISEYINRNGYGKSYVIHRAKYDNMYICQNYDFNFVPDCGVIKYSFIIIKHILSFKPDLIHVRAWTKGLILAKLFSPRVPIVFQYHGTEIRGREIPIYVKRLATKILVSTKDLLREGVEYYGRPISPSFKDHGNKRKGTALFIRTPPVDKTEEAKNFAKENNLELTILNRMADQPLKVIPFNEFPEFLSSFEYVLDLKGLTSREVLSKAGLEAIASGCKVLVDTGEIITETEQTPVEKYIRLYNRLITKTDNQQNFY
ncbi:MAG: hypothetical protein ACFFB2_06510 [Promethearchaeota archaeon]